MEEFIFSKVARLQLFHWQFYHILLKCILQNVQIVHSASSANSAFTYFGTSRKNPYKIFVMENLQIRQNNCIQPLTIVKKSSILDLAESLDLF